MIANRKRKSFFTVWEKIAIAVIVILIIIIIILVFYRDIRDYIEVLGTWLPG
jgi:hypothetical protein